MQRGGPTQQDGGLDWPGLLVLCAALTYFTSLLRYGLNLGEDGDLAYLIYRAFSGDRPYIDFASGYTPGFFFANATLFRLFGANLIVLRWGLIVIHSAAVFGLYRLARMVVPAALAVVPALGYATLLPVFPGENASFNIPYPAWYVVLTSVASTVALVRGLADRRMLWVAVAGLWAAVGCAFKPNTGAFNLAALVLTLLLMNSGRGSWGTRVLSWGLLAGVLGTLAAVFHFRIVERDARLLLWPVLILGGLCAVSAGRRTSAAFDSPNWPRSIGVLLGSCAAVTLPWLLYLWLQLGTPRFLSEVLFVGSGHESGFYLPIRALGIWDVGLIVLVLTAVAARRMVRAGRIVPAQGLAAAAAVTAVAAIVIFRVAPMPEGVVRAITQRAQHLSFGAALLVHWVAIGRIARLRRMDAAPGTVAAIAIAVGAPLMYLSIYPRSDFFHWVLSAPLTMVCGVMLYWQIAQDWVPRRASALWAALPAYALIVLFAWPNVTLAARVFSGRDALAHLDLAAAPIVLEAGRSTRLDDLRRTTEFIAMSTEPTATMLGFPNLQLLNFLAARHVPGRYGSFHPGWPDHLVEAQIINDLQAQRTPVIVFKNDVQLFVADAPLYFFLLRAYVQQRYGLVARIGSFDILRRRDAPQASPALSALAGAATADQSVDCRQGVMTVERDMPERAAVLAECWQPGIGAELQERAVQALRTTHDPDGARVLAEALQAGTLAARAALLAVRVIGEFGDARSIPALVAARQHVDVGVRDELDSALYNLATYALIGSYMFVPHVPGEDAVRADAASGAAARGWLEAETDPRLRFAAAWIAGTRTDSAALPALRRMLAEPNVGLQTIAADALIRMGKVDEDMAPLLAGLAEDERLLPSVVLAWCRANPLGARAALAEVVRHGSAKQRETGAFIAAACGDAAVGAVVRAGVDDPVTRVRLASLWAAGVLGIESARADIERVRRDDTSEAVRQFAQTSLQWLNDRQREPYEPAE